MASKSALEIPPSALAPADLIDPPAILQRVVERLQKGGVVSARAEAEQLMRHHLNATRVELYAGDMEISEADQKKIFAAVEKRIQGVPLAYLLGETEFFGHKFFVNESVLIPRPETEILVQEALKLIPSRPSPHHRPMTGMPRILDLCTGSACIAVTLTLERPDIRMSALDVSAGAIAVARKNRDFHGLEKKITLLQSDLFEEIAHEEGSLFDMIVSNPPYIPEKDMRGLPREVRCEPELALNGGREGLDVLEKILSLASGYLKSGGYLLLEIGQGQSTLLRAAFQEKYPYSELRFVKDHNGIERVLIARHG